MILGGTMEKQYQKYEAILFSSSRGDRSQVKKSEYAGKRLWSSTSVYWYIKRDKFTKLGQNGPNFSFEHNNSINKTLVVSYNEMC